MIVTPDELMTSQQSGVPMPFFSSSRERCLWAWTLAIIVAIYSTLGLASTLVGRLLESMILAICLVTLVCNEKLPLCSSFGMVMLLLAT